MLVCHLLEGALLRLGLLQALEALCARGLERDRLLSRVLEPIEENLLELFLSGLKGSQVLLRVLDSSGAAVLTGGEGVNQRVHLQRLLVQRRCRGLAMHSL